MGDHNNPNEQQQNQTNATPKKIKKIGEYAIGRTIGTGTFASVRQGMHSRTNQKVSIKILNKSLIEETKDKINLSRQLRILKKVRHPNIAQLLQTLQTNTRIYFVMEIAENGELFNHITQSKKGRLSEGFASTIFQQLLNAVEYLHTIGVAHRDIKPQNILLDYENNVKLIDFGLSSFYQRSEKLLTSCGSPCYAAPEMLVSQAYNPLLADLWSCGIVLYAMVCGFLPFEDTNTKTLHNLIKQGKYEEPKHMSIIVKDLLEKILKFNPEQRISITNIRRHPFCSPKQPIIRGLLPSQTLKLDEHIVEEMEELGYYAFKGDIQNNRNSSNTAAYYMLLYRRLRFDRKISLMTYFQKMQEEENIRSPYRSKSLATMIRRNVSQGRVGQRKEKQVGDGREKRRDNMLLTLQNQKERGGSLGILNRKERVGQNEEEQDFLDKIFMKNVAKMKEKKNSVIRIRKITS